MTDDIERLLAPPPDEPPPPEIVLAAVRAFRYRAIAVVAATIAGFLVLGTGWRALGPDDPGAQAAGVRRPTVVPILQRAEYDGIVVEVTELTWDHDRGRGYLRYLAWDTRSHAEVAIDPAAITASSGLRTDLFQIGPPALQDYTSLDGLRVERRTTAGWLELVDPSHDPHGPLSIEFAVTVYPLAYVLNPTSFDGPTAILTVEFAGGPTP